MQVGYGPKGHPQKEVFLASPCPGLGIPIVKKIVDAQQGRLEILDNPDKGVTFSGSVNRPLRLIVSINVTSLYVFDISSRQFEHQMGVVENLPVQPELSLIAVVRVFNKVDLVSVENARTQSARYQAIPVYALEEEALGELLSAIKKVTGSH
jgi:hypothetical protein